MPSLPVRAPRFIVGPQGPAGPERWPLYKTAASRAIESAAQHAVPPHTLMERAAQALERLARAIAPHARRVWIVAGPGNNGGDGLECAAMLAAAGAQVHVSLLAADTARLPPDASIALERARAAGVAITRALDPPPLGPHDLAIDALLGLGRRNRAPSRPLADAIAALNALPCAILSVDLPSGLDADTGWLQHADKEAAPCVRATHTLALLTLKPGLFTAHGRDHVGTVWFDDLGVAHEHPVDAWLVCRAAAAAERPHASHKGSYGDVVVIGGAATMGGAVRLAGRAAALTGAGRVFVSPLEGPVEFDPGAPELMMRDWTTSPIDHATVVCGCGGGEVVRSALSRVLARAPRLVLDADALNAVATDPMLAAQLVARAAAGRATVLTPHPLEAARLLGSTTEAVQSDRLAAAQQLADRTRAVVVLKGSGTVVAAPWSAPSINATGNAALANAGSGDVLAGMIGGGWMAGGRATDVSAAAQALIAAREMVASHGALADTWAVRRHGPMVPSSQLAMLAGRPL
ncbi:NAD(P)H-hydrate dehydratase [Caldimonas sp. KR1-144]|uniref:NAD(P)H-hydrate dehydratase n=1 Tax=Caldimonas sp. KR1-144 TaxID=3400911 RepID=UPI003C030509